MVCVFPVARFPQPSTAVASSGVAYRSTISPRSFSILTAGVGNWMEFGSECGLRGGQVVVKASSIPGAGSLMVVTGR